MGLQRRASIRVFVVASLVLSMLVTAGAAASQGESGLASMTEADSATDGLGSSVTEWSGATYNEFRNVIMTVDDETHAYEIPLDEQGNIDRTKSVRSLILDIGASDYEGVAWISGDQYAFLSEGTGRAYIANVSPDSRFVRSSDVVRSFDAGGPDGNTGSEGIATDGDYFYVTDEMPSSLSKYTFDGQFVAEVRLYELGDATGVVPTDNGSFIVLSDESAKASHYEIDWDAGVATEIAEYSLHGFPQVEGIAIIGNEQLHIFGERKGGHTYMHLVGEIVPPTVAYATPDVNCSGEYDQTDSLLILEVTVGVADLIEGCGQGDVNQDGNLSVADAYYVMQCVVGNANSACPATE